MNECKGCPTYIMQTDYYNTSIECLLSHFNENGECPCTSCLVKPVCGRSCDDIKQYSRYIREHHSKKYKELIEKRRELWNTNHQEK